MTDIHSLRYRNICCNCGNDTVQPQWKCLICPSYYLCHVCVIDDHKGDRHCHQFDFHHTLERMDKRRFFDDGHLPRIKRSLYTTVRRAMSDTDLQSLFVSHAVTATKGSAIVQTDSLCEFSQIQISDFNLPVPTTEKPRPIVLPVTEFNKRVHRHIIALQTQIGRRSPIIYHHPAGPHVVSCECYKSRSLRRFRHEFIVIVFEYSGIQYRVQFDRGYQKPGRASSQWLMGKPNANQAMISFASNPIDPNDADLIGRIVYQTGRLPLLTRTSKHVSEVFADAPAYFLWTWNCWLFSRVTFMRAIDLGPSKVAVWRDDRLDGQNILYNVLLRERSVAPWVSSILPVPHWLQLIGPVLGVRRVIRMAAKLEKSRTYLRYFLASFTSNAVRDFVTGDVLPAGVPHLFNKMGLSSQSREVCISELCASLSSPGHFLYFLTPPLYWARQHQIRRIEIIYSAGVITGNLQEEQLIDVATVHELSPAVPAISAYHRLQATREDWRNHASIGLGNSLIDGIKQGDRVGMWVNVLEGAKVSMFHALMKIFFSG